jgi:3-hydroxymyristoyl/3-hydroxydecanoyl-(acyl carrier protein) dehydratase
MTHVKMRSFITPGDVLQIEARCTTADPSRILLSARNADGRTVATARLETTSEPTA